MRFTCNASLLKRKANIDKLSRSKKKFWDRNTQIPSQAGLTSPLLWLAAGFTPRRKKSFVKLCRWKRNYLGSSTRKHCEVTSASLSHSRAREKMMKRNN